MIIEDCLVELFIELHSERIDALEDSFMRSLLNEHKEQRQLLVMRLAQRSSVVEVWSTD